MSGNSESFYKKEQGTSLHFPSYQHTAFYFPPTSGKDRAVNITVPGLMPDCLAAQGFAAFQDILVG
ncbi:MAG: hypothetical protein DBY44_03680 [Veillonellaceae bacterium]|nr:MAG: hypothetical protein DBY44_03680 [Veillonellaceae bacterium]